MGDNAGPKVTPYATNLVDIRQQAVLSCILQAIVASVLPALSYVFVFRHHERLEANIWLHWSIAVFAALLGIIASLSLSSTLLALHVILSAMLGAALAAYNATTFVIVELRCDFDLQQLWKGCSGCPCASTNSCTEADYKSAACKDCTAYSTDLCSDFESNKYIIAFTAVATVLSMALPALYNLIVLMRTESARSIENTKLDWVRSRVVEQTELADNSKPLTMPLYALVASIERLEQTKFGEYKECAQRARTALARAGYSDAIKVMKEDTATNKPVVATKEPESGTGEELTPVAAWQEPGPEMAHPTTVVATSGQESMLAPDYDQSIQPEGIVKKKKVKKIEQTEQIEQVEDEGGEGEEEGEKKKKLKKKKKKVVEEV